MGEIEELTFSAERKRGHVASKGNRDGTEFF